MAPSRYSRLARSKREIKPTVLRSQGSQARREKKSAYPRLDMAANTLFWAHSLAGHLPYTNSLFHPHAEGAVLTGMAWHVQAPKAFPLDGSLGIAIPVLASSVSVSGGSGEARRGIGEEDLKLWAQQVSPFDPPCHLFCRIRLE